METLSCNGRAGMVAIMSLEAENSGLASFVGWEVRGGASAGLGADDALALSQLGGTVEIYKLLAVAGRGFRPPTFLTVADISSQDAPGIHEAVGQADQFGDVAGFRQPWSLVYRQVVESNPRQSLPYAIYLLGVDPPAEATDEDLDVFNDFYTNVHLPEVAERRHALRSVRYELVREAKAPYTGGPRFLAIYEVDEASAAQRRHVGPPYSKGPAVWQSHRTPWRLWYRLLRPPN
jgi:hypothetical protein